MSSLSVTIDQNGATAPAYNDILAGLISSFQSIYGSDVYLGTDSQDYQLLAVFAAAINDANQACLAAYLAYSPTYAQGAGLSSQVKLNGLTRSVSTNSTADLLIVGQSGTVITNGTAQDTLNNLWDLPASVVIPTGGAIVATATARNAGALTAGAGTITGIYTPTRGWQSVTNSVAATPGAPVETDAALRIRQSKSTANPGSTVIEAIRAGVSSVAGVGRSVVYENATDTANSDGIPARTIAAVVEGGDVNDIANAIALRKPPGTQTFGSLAVTVLGPRGLPLTINLSALSDVQVYTSVIITQLSGYAATTLDVIYAALAYYMTSLSPRENVFLGRVRAVAVLSGDAAVLSSGLSQAQLNALSDTYDVAAVYLARADMVVSGGPYAAGATTVTVARVAELAVGQQGQIFLDNGAVHSLAITGIAGNDVTFSPAVPTGRTVQNGALFYSSASLGIAYNEAATAVPANATSVVS